jgi:amino acid adenylation domain-containing protein/non-ribosomal peptide synthase protein (TIGR01720 family)
MDSIVGYRLSPRQRHLWALLQHGGPRDARALLRLRGPLDADALYAAVDALAARHEVLRTAFEHQPEMPGVLQVPGESAVRREEAEDLSALAADARNVRIEALWAEGSADDGLAAARLVRTGADEHLLLLRVHALSVDEASWQHLARDLAGLYAAERGGAPVEDEPVPYLAVSEWLNEEAASDEAQQGRAYWVSQMEGVEAPLAVERAAPAEGEPEAAAGRRTVPGLASAADALAEAAGASADAVLLAGWKALLHRLDGGAEVRVAAAFDGRTDEELQHAVGPFTEHLPVITEVDAGLSFRALVDRLHTTHGDAADWQPAFDAEALRREGDPGGAPARVGFTVLPEARAYTGEGVEISVARSRVVEDDFALHLRVRRGGDGMELELRGGATVPAAQLDLLLERYEALLADALARPDAALGDLAVMSDAERARVLDEWNAVDAGTAVDACIHARFEAQAARTPDAPALTWGEETLSYAALNARANRLAHHLARLGAGPEVRVGICLERGVEVVVAILAVLKAGGAYVPLDPGYPAGRLAHMLEDSGVPLVVTQDAVGGVLPAADGIEIVSLDAAADAIAAESDENPRSGATPESLAYVIYTSGSTGLPKGALIEHRNVMRLFTATDAWFGFGPDDVWTLFHSTAFDFSVWEIWGALLYGGRLVVVPFDVSRDPDAFHALVQREGVTVLNQTPSAFRGFMRADAERGGELALREVVFGGEALEPASLRAWVERRGADRPRLVNMYGITETTVHVTYRPLSREDVVAGSGSPIGVRIPDLRLYVCDAGMHPVPVGVPGELYVGGGGVARGYLNRPELTAQRFIDNPFGPGRLYRTGDRVRWLMDGTLEYLGRLDEQVKIRGFRIELGEIEAALLSHGGVRECAVVVREDEPGDRRLVAYVIGQADAEALRAHLQQRLPDYMVPAAFVSLETLPLTPNGKLDRRALPAPSYEAAEFVAPRTAVEATLARIWAEVLRVERVGVEENFFALGGDSILSIQVVSRARRAGVELSPRQVFEHMTIAALAAVAGQAAEGSAEQGRVEGGVALTPIQAWFFEQGHPVPWHHNQAALLAVDPAVDDGALEAALAAVLEHHDALRLRFRRTDAGWEQWHAAEVGISLERVDLSAMDEAAQDRAQEEAATARQASLDLEQGPVGRAVLFDRGERGRVLLLALHHLVVDGVSWRILRDDLELACAQAMRGEAVNAGAKTTSFRQWSEALQAYAATDALAAEAGYWRAQGPEGTAPLPLDQDGDAGEGGTVAVRLDAEETRALLQEVPAAYRTQINDVLLCALAEALGAWTGSPRVRVALEGHGREEEIGAGVDLTRTVGWFTTVYPLVLDVAGADGPGERLKRVKEQLRAVPLHGIGYGVLRYLAPDAETRAALAAEAEPQVSFNYLGQFGTEGGDAARLGFTDGPAGLSTAPGNRRRYLLEVNGGIAGGCLELGWAYGGAHRRETVERVAGAFLDALKALIAHCTSAGAGGVTPSDFPLAQLTQAELDAVVDGRPVEDLYPLTPMQEGILFHAVSGEGAQAYQVQLVQRLEGKLDAGLLRRAWAEVVVRHAVLRTSFAWQGLRRPLQLVHPAVEPVWREEDWTGLSRAGQEAALEGFLAADRAEGFRLDEAPVIRFALFRADDDAHWFAWSQHHLVLDGWATSRVMQEVVQLYRAWSTGGTVELPRVRPYREYIAWLGRRDGNAAERYWRGVLAGFTSPTPLAADRPAAAGADMQPAYRKLRLDAELTARLEALARRAGVTLNTVMAGAWGLLLARHAGEDDVVFGTTVSARPPELEGVEEMVGLFINTLPVRMRLPAGARLGAWLAELQRTQVEAREHEYTPLVQVHGWSEVPRGTPLFESLFVFENYPIERSATGEVDAQLELTEGRGVEWSSYPLALVASPGSQLSLTLTWDGSRFGEESIDQVVTHLLRILEQAADGADPRLSEIVLTDADEHRRVVEEWNQTDRPYPRGVCLHELFESHVRERPEAEALVWGDERLGYAELDARANRLAHHLRRHGVGPDSRVGVLLERSAELIVSILAIIKAGGCYVTLDPSYPAERLRMMLADAGAAVLVTRMGAAAAVDAEEMHTLFLDAAAEAVAAEPAHAPRSGATPENLAYIVYTSGSTGTPKGVMVSHRNVVQLVVATDYVRFAPGDRIAQASNASFDAIAFETWGAFLNGATLVGIGRDVLLSPPALRKALRDEGITTLYQTTALLNHLSHEQPDIFAPLREVLFGGQAADADAVRRVLRAGKPQRLLHMYGPTETTAWCSYEQVESLADDALTVSVGKPTGNQRIYILDANLRPVPTGVAGEAYVGGDGVVRGYLDRPGLTAQRFVPDPFSGEPGARMYRTGDRLRWKADGTLEFVGRLDAQVKIRGFRIEPGEIESVLSAHEWVDEARVIVREDTPGEPRLVAYVVGEVNAGELREHLEQSLPEYMIPSAYVMLEQLPLTPAGKLDAHALPVPGAAEDAYVAPRPGTEEVLAGIWAQALDVERVGANDGFFALGGHSLLAMRVMSRIREAFGVELPLRTLFESPTLAETAEAVDALRRDAVPALPPIVPVDRGRPLPLSFAQERLWFLDRLQPGSTSYNVLTALRLTGALDRAALERALGDVVRRHEALRTVFPERDGVPVQEIVPFTGFALAVEDLSGVAGAEREAAVRERVAREMAQPYDLAAGPLFRPVLLRVDEQEHVLLPGMHHIVSDGWSMDVLTREVSALYAACTRGDESPLPELPVQYADFAVWQREQLQGEVLDGQMAYWKALLADAPEVLDLPTDRPRPAVQTQQGRMAAAVLPPKVLDGLETLARGEGATLYMVLLAAFQALLSRYSGSDDVVVGTPIAGRTRAETEGLIGFFVNTLVLRTDLSGNPGFRQLVRRVRDVTLGAYHHQEVPFEQLVAELQPERSLSHSPLFQVMFTLNEAGGDGVTPLPGLVIRPVPADRQTTKFDLTLTCSRDGEGLETVLEYNTDLFDHETVERMLEHLARLAGQVAADPELRLSDVELLTDAERDRVLEEWNGTARPYPLDVCIHQMVQAQAARTPDAVAVVFADASLTYAELDARANRLAHRLRRLGVGPEARVGVCAERSLEMVVALLGVLKAGGAYVPIDPGYPADRIAYMLADSGVPVLLTQARLADGLPEHGAAIVRLDADWDSIQSESADAPEVEVAPEGLAYVIYTSGSTGRPKGAMNAHRGVVNRLLWMQAEYGLRQDDVVLQKTPFSFDVSVWEFFWPLITGARLVLARPEGHREPGYLSEIIARAGVTTLHFVPSMLRAFLEHGDAAACGSVRRVVSSGEALPAELVGRFFDVLPHAELHNLYGPTEAAVDVTSWPCTPADAGRAVPIGRPIANTRVYIVGRRSQEPSPARIPGELHIGGVQVGRGYLGRPALTAATFVPDPFSAEPGARLYRTGDLARWRPDGAVEYLGRMDHQVKVRGFRVELGEIESVLASHPAVRETVVVAREDVPGDARLVAYVVAAGEAAGAEALRAFLRTRLPEHMVPSALVAMDALPLSPNGKIDRRALPAPERGGRGTEAFVAPRTPVEETLAGVWAEILRLERVGVTDDFFHLGGHSLLATRVMSRIREVFGVELPLRTLFDAPVLEAFAARVDAVRRTGGVLLPPVVAGPRPARVPLSFGQERMWYVDQLEPGSPLFNVPSMLRLSGPLDVDALGRALDEVVRRHEVLRTTLVPLEGGPVQVVAPAGPVALPCEDLSALPEEERVAEARRRAAAEAAAPFSLSAGPLLRARLLRLEAGEHVLLLTLHHVVTDGWSMPLLQREISLLYAAFAQALPSPLPEPALQYADYALWQRAHLAGALEGQLAYWTETMAGAPELLELPWDRPRPAVQGHRGDRVGISLPAELSAQLRALGRAEGATLFMTLLAAFDVLLSRWSGQTDVVVGTSIAGRTRAELEGLVGLFFNTLVLRTDVSGDPSFRSLVHRVRETTLGAYDHQDLPFERLVEALQPARTLRYTPLFQVLFEVNGAPAGGPAPSVEGLALQAEAAELGTAKYDLTLTLDDGPDGVSGVLEYDTGLFDHATAARLAGAYTVLLHAVAADPSRPVSTYPLLTPAERDEVLHAWNPAPAPLPSDVLVHRLFEAQVDRTPEAPALEWEGGWMSFGEMDARANQLAHHLRSLGVDVEARVGILAHRTPEMMIALFAVLKAGGAYVPLDPTHPAHRIGYTLADSGARVLVTESGLAERADGFAGATVLVDRWDVLAREPATRPATGVAPENLACVYYTSGSTGRPKGVLVHHRGVANYIRWGCRYYGADSGTGAPVFSSIAVDLTVTNFLPLFAGRRVVLVPEGPGVDALAALLRTRPGFSLIKITPTHLSLLNPLLSPEEARAAANTLVIGADSLRAEPTLFWQREAPGVRLLNEYGPTETVVGCAIYDVSAAAPASGPVSIGRTIENLAWYVLDGRMEPVPVGVPGELYIGGAGVARGYGGRPGLTAEKFVPDPFTPGAGARMYRTGDRARWLAGGQVEFLGRTDFQVKIRGYRVETGEVESVLMAHPRVARAFAVVREDTPGDPRLVAYVVPVQGAAAPETAELRALVRERLPEYMMPGAFVFLTEADVPASGKLSPAQLPAPEHAVHGPRVAPRTPVEDVLAGIWAEVLRVEGVGVEESFFDLGGHSLLATRIVSRIREVFGVELPLRVLFQGPTVAELARAVDALLQDGGGLQAPPVLPVPRDAPLPLSFPQERLWVLQQLDPASGAYNVGAPLRLRGPLDVPVLERSLAAIVARHEALRTRFPAVAGTPVQVVDPAGAVRIPLVDLTALAADAREAAMRALVRDESQRPFDLAAGPLLRSTLVRLAPDDHALFFTMHHIVSDGWSMSVLVRDVSELYTAFSAGQAPSLPPLSVQYADYAVWQRAWLSGDVLEAQLAYWRGALADVPALELPLDRPRPAVQTYRGAGDAVALPAGLSDALRALSRREGATLFMTLVASLQLLLARLSGQEDFAVGSPVAGRTRGETEGLIGCFLNNLVLRADLRGDPTFRELLGRVREATLGAYAHQDVPFEKLIDALRPPRDPARTPFFQVLVNLLPPNDGAQLRLGSVSAEALDGGAPQAKFDLTVYIVDGPEIDLRVVYNADLFDAETIGRMLHSWQVLLESAAAAPERRVSTVALLRPDDRARLAAAVHRPRPEVPFEPFPEPAPRESIAARFAARVRATPDALAVETALHRWTYADLDARANRVANALLRVCGAGPARVALFLDHDAPMLAGVLGALRAGTTYLPLDPAYPPERVRAILEDGEPAALLAEAAFVERVRDFAGGLPVLVLEDVLADGPADAVAVEVDPDAPAYILYTSGSTGVPKGVVQSHRNVLRHIRTYADRLHLGAGDRLSLFSAYGFDAAVMDIYGALLSGATLCPVSLRGEAGGDLPGEVVRRGITVFHSTPTVYRHLAAQLAGHDLSRVRLVVLGGEEVVPHDLELFRRHFTPGALFVNGFGPTECTIALQHFTDGRTPARGPVPLGRAVEDVEVRLLNADGEPVETFATGEITVRAAHVALGYWRRPELTGAAFLPDPEGGARRVYRTGDFGRLLPDGSIAFAGRRDGQVKIRGFRIETGEIESVLRADPRVRECAVVARDDAGEKQLVAYVVAAEGADPPAAELRARVRERLPDHMVPAAVVAVGHLPLTPNGKLDRRALPAPPAPEAVPDAYVAPRTQGEEVLAGIFAEVLRVERVGVETSFFELGGHSLMATRAVSRIRDVMDVELPLRAIFEAPTVAELAGTVEALRMQALPQLPPIVPVERRGPLPLSFAQERLWFLDRLQPGSASYNLPSALRLAGALDAAALERALAEVVRRHEALRTTFTEGDDGAVQVIAPFHGFVLPVEDLAPLDEDARESAARRRAAEEAARPFDLSAGPLFRASLLRLSHEEHVLLMNMHHSVSDGWSKGVLFRELEALYGAFSRGAESPLPELPVQYADYAVWQRERLPGEVMDRQMGYWRARLAGAPALLELPVDHPRPPVPSFAGGSVPVVISAALVDRLTAVGRGEGATLYMVLLGVFQALLAKYAGTDDVVVGTPIAGRTRAETEPLIGFFVNTLVLRTDLGGDPRFREVLRRVRDVTLGAFEHQDVPFEQLVAELQPERSMSHSPLFQVMFALNNTERVAGGALPGIGVSAVGGDGGAAKFDLSLTLTTEPGGVGGELAYRTDLFEPGTIERMAAHLGAMLEQVAGDADLPLSGLNLVRPEDLACLEAWNATGVEYPSGECVHTLFEGWAARTPDAVALVFGDVSVTYGELDAQANRLANHLRRHGVGPEVRVALCLERGPELVAAVLGILKAGGAYVPLDPAYPEERLAYMLADSAAAVLVTRESLRGALPLRDGLAIVSLDGAAAEIAAERGEPVASGARARSLAYVMYTSGSTGRPKGVAVEHRSVVRLVRGANYASFGPDTVMLQAAPVSFDASTLELWGALLNGGRLVLPSAATPSLEELGEVIRRHGVTMAWLTSGLFQAMVEERLEDLGGLRQLIAGGDVLPAWHVMKARRRFPELRIVNGYGPTENTTFTCCYPVPDEWSGAAIPIGGPISSTRVYVLDTGLRHVPVGLPGELFAAGDGVARGYLGRPALTAERFLPDPFVPGARMYRTGDGARWLPEGVVDFRGRLDEQVKIRGFRIELGEIEALLRMQEGVRDCAAVVREDVPGDKRLVAYVVGDAGEDALRGHLRRSLPEYMVPGAIVVVEALPLTPNGKLDRRALPAPPAPGAEASGEYAAPRTPVEEVLGEIFAEVLRVERVGVEDSFFALGGHSLLAMRVVSRIREVFGVELPLRALFEGPTVGDLAGRVEEMRRAGLPALPPVVPVERTGPMPLSFAQERMWFLDRLSPGGVAYNIPLAVRLGGTLDAAALERALGEVVRRHDALRTTFGEVDGAPVQVVAPFAGFVLPTEDLSELGEVEREAAVLRRASAVSARPFDLTTGPLFGAELLRLGEEEHVLLMCMHHIVSDGWSMDVLYREMSALYAAYAAGGESPLPELAVQYADYAAWQREQLDGHVLDRQLAYWREQLSGAPEVLDLPADHPRPAAPSFRGDSVPLSLPLDVLEKLKAVGRGEGATLYMVALGAFQVLLSKYTGSNDIVVGSPIAGRMRGETEGLIGFFVNTLVLRTDLGGDPRLREVVRRVRDVTLGAYEHQDVPFERLVVEMQPERSLSHSPLFQVMFTLESGPGAGGGGGGIQGLNVARVGADVPVAKFDLALGLVETPHGLEAALRYSTDLFERASVERMAVHLAAVLEQVAKDADLRLSALELVSDRERAQVAAWNATERPYPSGERIHTLFEAWAARTPDAAALVFGDVSVTYGELDAQANRLANHLRRHGVGPEVRVALCLERGPELVAAVLGILKAGGAYVPLDPEYPAERLSFMLEDSAAPVVVTREGLRGILPPLDGLQVVTLDGAAAEIAEADAAPRTDATSGGLAYVIYTSGSTGTPKGVAVEHRAVVRLVRGTDFAQLAADDRVAQASSPSFDAATFEIWGALLNGAALVGIPRDVALTPADLARTIAAQRITTVFLTTALFNQVARELPAAFAPLRHLLFGGEAVDPDAVRRVLAAGGPERLLHVYGPTENTTFSSWHVVTEVPAGAATVPIGRAVANSSILVFDSSLRPVPVGIFGELYVGGDGLARGYLGRPALTAEKFLPDPSVPGARMYRTGDLGRWLQDGTVDLRGRIDGQVKIRGFRVEPGEPEALLRGQDGVRDCAVVVREDQPGNKRLVAYVVGDADPDGLRARLRDSLPDYLMPTAFVTVDALPLTPNGKLDARALPVPEYASAERYVAPRTPAEEVLAGIWTEVMGVEAIGVHQGFFELGGHSLLAMRVVSRVREAFGVELPLASLFRHTTIAELAPELEALVALRGPDPHVPDEEREATLRAAVDEMSEEELDRLLAHAEGD